jgi:hypothetical protein
MEKSGNDYELKLHVTEKGRAVPGVSNESRNDYVWRSEGKAPHIFNLGIRCK